MPDIGGAGVALFDTAISQERHCVSGRQQPQPDDRSTCRRIDHSILLARHEPRSEIDVAGIGYDPAIRQLGEGPLHPRDYPSRDTLGIINQQHRLRIGDAIGRIRTVQTIGEQLDLAQCIWLEFHHELAGDRPAGLLGVGGVDAHQPGDRRYVVLPAAPHYGITLAHQKSVSNIQWRTGDGLGRCAIEHPQRQAVPSVEYIEQQTAIAASGILRGKDADIGRKMDEPVAVTRSQSEVRDSPV